ncbi:hypothetical protein C7974DRAFT_418411 [Boeremia exigua]|uniref:uncharacterized protein n=1 Tax=Boeremia exigua TaxID=749465 RepID=UPI001E8D5D59|nr:uncharacterized protein C7974DRAFT_418411 [Boeremia exigua]KAH6612464.1 hypothetical protein C7974DRAFT_418411 [Boeremia exigua]
MHISKTIVAAFLANSLFVHAAPAPKCDAIDAVYAILRGPLKAKASSFCLSFLGGDKTARQTQTQTLTGATQTATVTLADQTVTETSSTTNVNLATTTVNEPLPNPTTTTTVTVTAGTSTIYQKRDAQITARNIPPELAAFAASRISKACSCIVTPTTTTITSTTTASVAGPTTTATLPGNVVTVTAIITVQTTSTITTTSTVAAVDTVTQTYTTTVTPILVKPKICNARGLPGANAFNYDANFNTNQAACIASCKSDNRCYATGFYLVTDPSTGTTTGTCRKYDKSVTDTADLGPGYYNFNDKAC